MREQTIESPFDIRRFCDQLGARRGRPIHLLPIDSLPGGPCGIWIAGARADYICYEARTSPLHAEHIILHEVGHLLRAHQGPETDADDELLPDLDPAMVRRVLGRPMLGRTHYDSAEEHEAELIASLILQRAGRPRTTPPSATNPALHRLRATFETPGPGRG